MPITVLLIHLSFLGAVPITSLPLCKTTAIIMPVSQAKVKSVLSGDTLVLTSVNNPNQERILSLAFVSAPRMRREGDEVSQERLASYTHTPEFTFCKKGE